jgi:ABC-2 type transport system permease protein
MTLLHETWLDFDTNMRTTLRNPSWLTFGLFQPVLWLVLFAPVLDNLGATALPSGDALAIFASGMLVLLALYGSVFIGFGLLPETRAGVMERLNVTVAHRSALVLGRVLRDLAVLLVQSTLLLGIAWLVGLRASAADVLVAMGLVLAIGLLLASGANALALLLKNDNRLATTLNFVTLPLVLLSGIMLPLVLAPGWIQAAAGLNPFVYAIDAACALIDLGFMVTAVFRGIVVGGALALLALGWAVRSFRRVAAA